MKSVLYQLYEGGLYPMEKYQPFLKEHQDLLRNKHFRHDAIKEELRKINPELNWELEHLLEEQREEMNWDTAQMFIDGFRLGARMMIEVYQKDFTAKDTE